MRLLRKDYVRSKPNGKFVSAVCYAINSFSCHKAQVFRSFSVNWCKVKSIWKLFFLISKGCNFSEVKFLLEISFEGPFCLCIVLASPFRETAPISRGQGYISEQLHKCISKQRTTEASSVCTVARFKTWRDQFGGGIESH